MSMTDPKVFTIQNLRKFTGDVSVAGQNVGPLKGPFVERGSARRPKGWDAT